MGNYRIGAAYALISAFVGMFLPMTNIGPIQNPTNLLFGFVYGFGWFVAGFADDVRSRYVEPFGFWIWPTAILLLITYIVGRVLANIPRRRTTTLLYFVGVLFFVVPGSLVATTPLKYVPIFSSIFLTVY